MSAAQCVNTIMLVSPSLDIWELGPFMDIVLLGERSL